MVTEPLPPYITSGRQGHEGKSSDTVGSMETVTGTVQSSMEEHENSKNIDRLQSLLSIQKSRNKSLQITVLTKSLQP